MKPPLENADFKIDVVNMAEAGKLIEVCLTKEKLRASDLEELVCRRKKEGKRGRKIGITTAEAVGKLYKDEGGSQGANSLFDPPSNY